MVLASDYNDIIHDYNNDDYNDDYNYNDHDHDHDHDNDNDCAAYNDHTGTYSFYNCCSSA
jgi:hypothetical protein